MLNYSYIIVIIYRLALLGYIYAIVGMEMHRYIGRHCRRNCVVPLSALSPGRRLLHTVQGNANLIITASHIADVRATRMR